MTMRPDPTFHASPKLAMEAPPENFAYTLLLSPDFSKPDALGGGRREARLAHI
jgi:selenium-binding protein 1